MIPFWNSRMSASRELELSGISLQTEQAQNYSWPFPCHLLFLGWGYGASLRLPVWITTHLGVQAPMCPLFTIKGTWGSSRAAGHKVMYEQNSCVLAGQTKDSRDRGTAVRFKNKVCSVRHGEKAAGSELGGPFRNWKSLEMWTSLFLVTAPEFQPTPPFPAAPPWICHGHGNANSKVFTKKLKKKLPPILFPNPKSRSSLPQGAFL